MNFLDTNNKFTKEKIEILSKVRLLKKNLIHVHGFPKSIAKTDKLKSNEYFGQYGDIIHAMIKYKMNPITNKKAYSAYITYSNEKEAAFAILCIDSLLFEGKIIRAFFGTTKYCKYFLNSEKCLNYDKCSFLHELANDNDIIIGSNTNFSYDDHIKLCKKIIDYSNPETQNFILKLKKPKKSIFPFMDFIFLSEKEKENYFPQGSVKYISGDNSQNNIYLNNYIEINDFDYNNNNNKNVINFLNDNTNNNYMKSFNLNDINYPRESRYFANNENIEKRISEPSGIETWELYKIFNNSINHILKSKPFFSKLKGLPLQKLELDYLKKELEKEGNNINELLGECLDCLN